VRLAPLKPLEGTCRMLISLGTRAPPEDLVGLLLECHQRIRTFARLAQDVGRRRELPDTEVVEACARVERYFVQALPLHVEDEEHSLLPRLRGHRADVDAALDAMHAQHDEHAPFLAAMLAASAEVRATPSDARARDRLLAAATALSAEFERHLVNEEQVLFPAVRELLGADAQAQAIAELRARRQPTP
jgi:iron-sulfur cluster repair protein YtfE (RIC family)